jgi:hypothetical protein
MKGYLEKMVVSYGDVVQYKLKLADELVDMNGLIGHRVSLTYLNQIKCVDCGAIIKKAYGQGFCFQCLQESPLASECILRPEKCKAHLGISRSMVWSESHCLAPHVVYLAYSSHIKVGVTRVSQIPTRWIDQGAMQAIVLANAPNRHIAGMIEVFLKQHFSDKTAWQQMLATDFVPIEINLENAKERAISLLPKELRQFVVDGELFQFHYPIVDISEKMKAVSFDKETTIEGILNGIKGQYLIFNGQLAFNVRKHTGYFIEMTHF